MIDHYVGERVLAPLCFTGYGGAEEFADEELVFDGWQDILLQLKNGQLELLLLILQLLVAQWKQHAVVGSFSTSLQELEATFRFDKALNCRL